MPSNTNCKWLNLQVKFSGIIPEIANIVQVGDIEKDAFDKVEARIGTITSNKQSEVLFRLASRRSLTITQIGL